MTLAGSGYVVLDTSVVSLIMRGSAQADYYSAQIVNHHSVLSFQTVEELWHGSYYDNWGTRRQDVLAMLLRQYEVIWPDADLVDVCA